jgi:hypothetical protein
MIVASHPVVIDTCGNLSLSANADAVRPFYPAETEWFWWEVSLFDRLLKRAMADPIRFFQPVSSNAVSFVSEISPQQMQAAARAASMVSIGWLAAGRLREGEQRDDSVGSILRRLDTVLNDQEQYETDETPPARQTVMAARNLLRSMSRVGYENLPKTYISVYYGEIAISWKTDRNLVRLTFRPNGTIELYRQADYRDSARGEATPVTVDDNEQVAAYIRWLSEDTRATPSGRSDSHR